jgi:cytochrome c oxidase subunit 3
MSAEADSHATPHRDYIGAKLGMWIFIFTELILFRRPLRRLRHVPFHAPARLSQGRRRTQRRLGVINTVVLLTSSLTMVLSIVAVRLQRKGQAMLFLGSTVVLGCVFLFNKFFEWKAKIHHGLYPGSEHLMARPPGERLFFGLYYGMTGLHGLHVTVGVVLLSVMFALLRRDKIRHDDFVKLENSGLYWHLVDIIWIFLLPLFYLAA